MRIHRLSSFNQENIRRKIFSRLLRAFGRLLDELSMTRKILGETAREGELRPFPFSPFPPLLPPRDEAQRNSIANKTRSLPCRCNPPDAARRLRRNKHCSALQTARRLGNRDDDRRLFAESLPCCSVCASLFSSRHQCKV